MTEPSAPMPAASPTAVTGASNTTVLAAVASVRRLLVVLIVITLAVGGALAGLVLATRASLVETNDRLSQLQQSLAATQAPAQPSAAAKPASVTPATALTGVDTAPQTSDEGGALLIGDPDAANVVEVFVDFQCPYCQKWHQQIGRTLEAQALEPDSDLLLKVNPLAFLMEASLDLTEPGASARAANAAACVADAADPQALSDFTAALFAAADPTEPPGQFPTEQLVALAEQSGASPASLACITDQGFMPYVSALTKASFARGVSGTPTVLVNGQQVGNPFTAPELTALVSAD